MSFNKKPKTINPDEVDLSVYYYDEVYDEMKESEKLEHDELHGHSSKDKKHGSKYIQGLKETAELRKVEKELRKFKKYARDREEAEVDGEFSDKEVFITAAYEEKLKEMKRVEDERRKLLELENDNSLNFIKKQKVAKEIVNEVAKAVPLPQQSDATQNSTGSDLVERHSETQVDSHRSGHESQDSRPLRRKLITLDERRDYLREVLAKKTVGRVYDEAVQRYLSRKALAQH